MAVTYYLYCEETGHGVMVGQDSMRKHSDQIEPSSVVSLFCLAHREKSLEVVGEPDMVSSWEADIALELYQEVTGKPAPEAWRHLNQP